jgi:phosphoribosylformylglycinamidine (FGAM) synthase PurS component
VQIREAAGTLLANPVIEDVVGVTVEQRSATAEVTA